MRQRPIACLSLLVFLLLQLIPPGFFYEPRAAAARCSAQITGRVIRQEEKNEKTQLYLSGCQVDSEEGQFQTDKILVYLSGIQEYPVGCDLSLSGTIYPIEEPTNPGQFNSRLYYEGKGIAYTFYAERLEVLSEHPAPVGRGLLALRRRLGEVYDQVLGEKDSGLLSAMVLGQKGDLDAETRALYQRNGISHLLAISGLHLSLVGMGFYRMLRRLTGSYVAAGIPALLFLSAYGWMTGASISTVRAALMCGLAILADLIGRTYDMLTAIGASALILMATDPLTARQSAFLLSYGAVLAIALLVPLWKLYKKKYGRIGASLSVSLSVLLVTFPLLLCFFYEYPLYSTWLNLLVIPLMSILMICGLLCGGAGLFCLPAARLLAFPCHLILTFYEWTGRAFLKLPGALLTIGCPAAWKILLYYSILAVGTWVLYREKRREKYWRKKEPFCPRRTLLAAVLLPVLTCVCLLCTRISRGMEIRMLDVGQGDGIFFRTPSGLNCLYDSGSSNVSQVGAYRVLPFLKWSGVRTLDYVFLSHMDQDHVNGVKELIEDSVGAGGIRIRHGVLPALQRPDDAYEEMEALFEEAGIPVLYLGTGDVLRDGELSLTCLYPEKTSVSDDRNDLSLVILADYREFQMLFTGDIGRETEKYLEASGMLQEVEILKTAHHGSRHSSDAVFLEAVRPAVSLISCSATNRYGHPGEETLKRLEGVGSRIYMTKDQGAIRIWTDGDLVRVSGYGDL